MYLFALVAIVAAGFFAYRASQTRRAGPIVAVVAWLLYAIYEFMVGSGVLCDDKCNIRVDLIVIWPVLWIASLFGFYARGQWTVAGKVVGGLSAFFVTAMIIGALYIMLVETPAAQRAAKEKAASGTTGTK